MSCIEFKKPNKCPRKLGFATEIPEFSVAKDELRGDLFSGPTISIASRTRCASHIVHLSPLLHQVLAEVGDKHLVVGDVLERELGARYSRQKLPPVIKQSVQSIESARCPGRGGGRHRCTRGGDAAGELRACAS
eukprot:1537600-Prymnesium_polylepis.1